MPKLQFFIHRWLQSFLLWMLVTSVSSAWGQEPSLRGFRFYQDEHGQTNGVEVSGINRLRVAKLDTLPELTYLNVLYGAKLTADDIAYLATLTQLQELIIGQESIDPPVTLEGDLSQLATLKSLKTLHLCKHNICDADMKFVASLSELTSITFNARGEWEGNVYELTDRCAEYLSQAKKLRTIYIQDQGSFSDSFVDQIAKNCRSLEHLNIGSDRLTDSPLRSLADHCEQLTFLDFSAPKLTPDALKQVARMEKLEMLSLNGPIASSRNVVELKKLRLLRHLGLRIGEIDDESMRAIASLENLEILALHDTILTDEQMAILSGHPKLESIFMQGQKLTEAKLLQCIDTIPNLRHISLGRDCQQLETLARQRISRSR